MERKGGERRDREISCKAGRKEPSVRAVQAEDGAGDTFFVTLGVNCGHRCLTVYTAEEWKRLSDNYNAMSISQRSGATSLIFMNAAECSPDKQYRFSLTQFLLSYAGIDREVMIVGRAGQAEIWDAKEFADFERENLTPGRSCWRPWRRSAYE